MTNDNSCTTTDTYVNLPGGPLLTLSPANTDTTKRVVYSVRNFHGDTALTVNATGLPTSSVYLYEPFGMQSASKTFGTSSNPVNSSNQAMGWAADPTRKAEPLITLAVMQMGKRTYIPSLGRFLQVDPIEGGAPNAYAYVGDPINSNDYSGLFGWSSIKNIVKKVVVAAIAVVMAIVAVITVVGICGATVGVGCAAGIAAGAGVVALGTAAAHAVNSYGTKNFNKGATAQAAGLGAAAGAFVFGGVAASGLLAGPTVAKFSQSAPSAAQQVVKTYQQTGTSPYRVAQFANDGRSGGQILPKGVTYLEHDIYPVVDKAKRGLERVVTGSDGSAWYTSDHYQTFTRIK